MAKKKKGEIQQLLFELSQNGMICDAAIRGELQVLATMAGKQMAEEIRMIVEDGDCDVREAVLELSGIEIPNDEPDNAGNSDSD